MSNSYKNSPSGTELWSTWWKVVITLRPAFSRTQTFHWFVLVLIAFSVRGELLGVTSFIRALGLGASNYENILHFFHSHAVKADQLAQLWLTAVLRFFPVYRIDGKPVAILDGVKNPKEGRKMPAVKHLYQGSGSNSKPEFVMGHSFQAFGILCSIRGYYFCVPVCARIHEGLVFSNRDKRTLIDKAGLMLDDVFGKTHRFVLLADAYYSNGKMLKYLTSIGSCLVTRMRSNAVAHEKAATPAVRKRGRPKKYGAKIKLSTLFGSASFTNLECLVYGESARIEYATFDLLWRPFGKLVRFVLVKHPARGRMILMCSDLTMEAREIIELYSLRFKIEVTFKHAIHNVGAFGYHFWMSTMRPLKRGNGNQHLHRQSQEYRDQIIRKMRAYHCYVQVGLIAQGMLQYLSMTCEKAVWKNFGSWIRTIRPNVLPSEAVVSAALRNTFPEFLTSSITGGIIEKFITSKIDTAEPRSEEIAA